MEYLVYQSAQYDFEIPEMTKEEEKALF